MASTKLNRGRPGLDTPCQPTSVLFGPGPTLCGHRGSGRGIVDGQRENTLGSFRAAVAVALGSMPLADLFEALPAEIGFDVDIKTAIEDALRPREETTAALTAALAAAHVGRRRLLLSSFDASALGIVRERVPDVA